MSFYKFIQFENCELITLKLQNHFKKMLDSTTLDASPFFFDELHKIVPELTEQFKNKNLIFDIGRAFVTPPNCYLPIHIDGTEEVKKDLALNWPLFNTEKSAMSWYSVLNHEYKIYSDSRYSPHTKVYAKENCKLEESLVLLRPSLVKIGVPHDVYNFGTSNRIIISFRFNPEPYELWNGL